MKKTKIYTRGGDLGETSLVSGNRVLKGDERIDLYGELDELHSRLGVICAHLDKEILFQQCCDFLHHLQSAVFDLGSNLACEAENRAAYKLPQISAEFIKDMEEEIDRMEHELPPLKNFILPGGTLAAASVHLARTGARSVERKLIRFHHQTKEAIPENGLIFLNRMSDYLFVLARYVNKQQGGTERLWKPRK